MSSSLSSTKKSTLSISSSMEELLAIYPGGRRALFQRYHLGGCSSCSFSLEETLEELCQRSGKLDPNMVLEELEKAHHADEQLLISPKELYYHLHDPNEEHICLLDIRTREEFEAVHIPTSQLLTQDLMETTMNHWPKENLLVLIDHRGERSLNAAAYFAGHGFLNVKSLRGGIDAYAEKTDRSLPRYEVEQALNKEELKN